MIAAFLKKLTLIQALVLMISISLLLPIPLLLGVYAHDVYKTKEAAFVQTATKKFELSSEIFKEALWNYYTELAQTMQEQLALDKELLSLRVTDETGASFLHWERDAPSSSSSTLTLEKPLVKHQNVIGHVSMQFKTMNLKETLLRDFTLFGPILLLQILFVVGVVSLVYFFKILFPIRQLMAHSKSISQNQLDTPFAWEGKDEIARLGQSMETTRQSLKSLFNRLKKQNEELDEKVRERTKALERANQYKSEFLANMSHEIRTPMNAIIGMCHLIRKTSLQEGQKTYVNRIHDASNVLLHIINDILDFSKIEAGKMDIEYIAFDLHKELKKSTAIFAILAKEKSLEFESNFIHTHRFFKGDPHRINQILNNFLSNAIKFTDHGKIRLHVTEAESNATQTTLTFSVSDTGSGIPHEAQSKLFKAFSQADTSTTRNHGGTGLGLFICAKLANMMDGKLHFQSVPERGSTFSLTLPLTKIEGAQLENDGAPLTPLHILLYLQDAQEKILIEEYLRSFGYFSTAITSPKAVKDALAQSHFHLCISDAVDILPALQEEHLPLIFIENEPDQTVLENANVHTKLKRPINPSLLYDDIILLCHMNRHESIFDPTTIDFSDKTLLLVEDNDTNLEVACYLLQDTRATLDTARNGLEAVQKAQERIYDAILMDVQMPIMDGYEATRIIKDELKLPIPIVAMTANVMVQDIQKCLDIGMVAHIGKPFDIEDFYGTLLEVFDRKVTFTKSQNTAPKEIQFDKQGAIKRLGNNVELWKKTRDSFCQKYDNFEAKINQFCLQGDYDTCLNFIHSLKGLSAGLGLGRVHREAKACEAHLKLHASCTSDVFKPLIKELKTIWPELSQGMTTPSKAPSQETPSSDTKTLLAELEEALDMASISKTNTLLAKLQSAEEVSTHTAFTSLARACESVDFDLAKEYLAVLKKELYEK